MGSLRPCITAAMVASASLLSASSALAQAASDSLASATPIMLAPFTATSDVSAATTAPDERATCVPTQVRSVWYRYLARADGTFNANTLRSDYDTVLTVWEGPPNSGGRPIGCNDDAGGLHSSVTFPVRAGVPYFFQIARYDEAPGGNLLTFTLRPETVAPPPPNDEFANALSIPSIPFTTTQDMAGATASSSDPMSACASFGGAPTVWYSRAPSEDEALLVDTSGSAANMSVTVYRVDPDGLTQVSCSPFGYPAQSVRLRGGERYYFMVTSPPPRPGMPMSLRLAVTPLPPPPANDAIAGATVISGLPYSIEGLDTRGATRDPSDPTCMEGEQNNVWFAYTPSQNVGVILDTAGSDYATSVAVFSSSGGALTQTACFPAYYYEPRVNLTAHQTYYFMVAALPGYRMTGGQLSFHVTPALALGMTVGNFGLASLATGAVQVNGTVTCTVPAQGYVSGSLRQRSGRGYIDGNFGAGVECGTSPTTWRATFTSSTSVPGTPMGRFAGGQADLSVSAWAYTTMPPYQSASTEAQASITLRGTSPKSFAPTAPPTP